MEPVNSQNEEISNYLSLMLHYVEYNYRFMGSQFVGRGAINSSQLMKNFKTYEEKVEIRFFEKKYGNRFDKNGHKLTLKEYRHLYKIGFKEYILNVNNKCYLHLCKVPCCLLNLTKKRRRRSAYRKINPRFLQIPIIGIRHNNQLIPWIYDGKCLHDELKPYPYELRLNGNCFTSIVADHTLGKRDTRHKGRKLICIEFFDGYYPINETDGSFPAVNYIKQRCKFLSDGKTLEHPICLIFDEKPGKNLKEIFRETDTTYYHVPKLSALVSNVIAKNVILLADDICDKRNNNNSNERMKPNASSSSSSFLGYNHAFQGDHLDTHIHKLKLDYGIFDMDNASIQCIDKAIQQAIRFQADSINSIIEACICGDLNQVKNCCESGYYPLTTKLARHHGGSLHRTGFTPLGAATFYNQVEIVKYLVEVMKVDIHLEDCIPGFDMPGNVMHIAAIKGNIDLFKYFVEECNGDFSIEDWNGNTPLAIAMVREHSKAITSYIESTKSENS